MSDEEITALDSAIARIEKAMREPGLSQDGRRDLAEVLKTLRAMREAILRER